MKEKKLPPTLCRLKRALQITRCRLCDKKIYILQPFYKVPYCIIFFYGIIIYEDYFSDHHCKECHDKKVKQLGFCPKCQAFVKEKKVKAKIEICLR